MKSIAKISILFFFFFSVRVVFAANVWVGNITKQITRLTPVKICDTESLSVEGNSLSFGSWERMRALVTNLCFEVYKEGVTEYYRSNITSHMSVSVMNGDVQYDAQYIDHIGNNALYVINLRLFDPERFYFPTSNNTQEGLLAHLQVLVDQIPIFKLDVNYLRH